MRISRIYYDGVLTKDTTIDLPADTSHYIFNVLRLSPGASLTLFNGNDVEHAAVIQRLDKKKATIYIQDCFEKTVESPIKIHLAQALSRGEKMDWIVQKAVELGVASISPLFTDYCSVKLSEERSLKRVDHWKKIAISACEQSGRNRIPSIYAVKKMDEWLHQASPALKLYCDPLSSTSIKTLEPKGDVLVLIGPEGGLSNTEVEKARGCGFIGVSLGPRVLRTETAAIAVLAIIQHQWGDI